MTKATKKVATKKTLSPLRIGNNVLIRTVTHYLTGHIEEVGEHEIVLTTAAWIADTGRFSTAIAHGEFNEIEPFIGPVAVGRGAIVDVTDWTHPLPVTVK